MSGGSDPTAQKQWKERLLKEMEDNNTKWTALATDLIIDPEMLFFLEVRKSRQPMLLSTLLAHFNLRGVHGLNVFGQPALKLAHCSVSSFLHETVSDLDNESKRPGRVRMLKMFGAWHQIKAVVPKAKELCARIFQRSVGVEKHVDFQRSNGTMKSNNVARVTRESVVAMSARKEMIAN